MGDPASILRKRIRDVGVIKESPVYTSSATHHRLPSPDPYLHQHLSKRSWERVTRDWRRSMRVSSASAAPPPAPKLSTPPPPTDTPTPSSHNPARHLPKPPPPTEPPTAFTFSEFAYVFHPGMPWKPFEQELNGEIQWDQYRQVWPQSLAWLGGIPDEWLPFCINGPHCSH